MRMCSRIAAGFLLITCGIFWRPAVPSQAAQRTPVPTQRAPEPAHRLPSPSPLVTARHLRVARRPAIASFRSPSAVRRHAAAPSVSDDSDFTDLRAFSAQTNYMSLLGYVRYWTYQREGRWITNAEAARIIKSRPARHVRTARGHGHAVHSRFDVLN